MCLTRATQRSALPCKGAPGVSSRGGQLGGLLRERDFDAQAAMLAPVQRKKGEGPARDEAEVHRAADQGIASGGGAMPHADKIQASFGRFGIGDVQAHVGSAAREASRAIGARAYASGDHVAFDGAPDLHTAAHEAAHVVQQRAGVSLAGGVGKEGDDYERHADRVADAVVAGRSAEGLLEEMAGGGAGRVQRRAIQRAPGRGGRGAAAVQRLENEFASFLDPQYQGLDPRSGLLPHQQAAVEELARQVGSALVTWEKQRGTPELEFKRGTDVAIALHEFNRKLISDPHHALVRREAQRRLRSGFNEAWVREIRMFNPGELAGLRRLLEVEDVEASHSYEFRPIWGTAGGWSGRGVKVGAVAKRIEVRYTNSQIPGLSWTQSVSLTGLQLGFGVTVDAFKKARKGEKPEMERGGSISGPGKWELAVGQPRERYLPPSFFEGASFTSPSASASANLGPATAKKSFGSALLIDNGDRLLWDMPAEATVIDEAELGLEKGSLDEMSKEGIKADAGIEATNEFGQTALVGELEFDAGQWPELENKKVEPSDVWVPLHYARIFFERGSAELEPGRDVATLQKIVKAILAWDDKPGYRGSFFKIEVSGCHSQVWDEVDDELRKLDQRRDENGELHGKDLRREGDLKAQKEIENYQLAMSRAENTQAQLLAQLGVLERKDRLVNGVKAGSQVADPTTHEPLSDNPYSDYRAERSATILVSYQIFNPRGAVAFDHNAAALLDSWKP